MMWWCRADGLNTELFHEQVCNKGAKGGTHGCPKDLLIILTMEEELCVSEVKLQYGDYLGDGHVSPMREKEVLLKFALNYGNQGVHRY